MPNLSRTLIFLFGWLTVLLFTEKTVHSQRTLSWTVHSFSKVEQLRYDFWCKFVFCDDCMRSMCVWHISICIIFFLFRNKLSEWAWDWQKSGFRFDKWKNEKRHKLMIPTKRRWNRCLKRNRDKYLTTEFLLVFSVESKISWNFKDKPKRNYFSVFHLEFH